MNMQFKAFIQNICGVNANRLSKKYFLNNTKQSQLNWMKIVYSGLLNNNLIITVACSELAENLDGSRACFVANGLDVLGDEEYLTITTTAASPPVCSNASSRALTPPTLSPLPPSPHPHTSPPKIIKPPPPLAQPTSTSTNNGWDDEEEEDEDPRRVQAVYTCNFFFHWFIVM